MKRADFLLLLEQMMEEEPNTLKGPEGLKDLDMWDSMVALEFIALVDTHFGIIVSAEKLSECQTVNDLISLLDEKIVN